MPLDRREFLQLTAGGLFASASAGRFDALISRASRFKAVAFDAFPIFDPRPVFALAETLFPGKGAELSNAWRSRQFEYQWLRALGGRYTDFARTTEDALVFAATSVQVELSAEKRDQLMHAFAALHAWPDVPAALTALKNAGVRLAFCSNMTESMLRSNIANAGLDGMFEHVLSSDRIKSYKPDPRAYRLAVDALELKREEIVFAAFAGWDVAGAKWFGYPTVWVNRANAPLEALEAQPDAMGRDLGALLEFVDAR
jgi:2-haloacid dehalogenase